MKLEKIKVYTNAQVENGMCAYAFLMETVERTPKYEKLFHNKLAHVDKKFDHIKGQMLVIYYALNQLCKPCNVELHTNLHHLEGVWAKIKKDGRIPNDAKRINEWQHIIDHEKRRQANLAIHFDNSSPQIKLVRNVARQIIYETIH